MASTAYDHTVGRHGSKIQEWEARLQHGEEVVLATNKLKGPDGVELDRPRYPIQKEGDVLKGILDPTTRTLYLSPSALCCAKLERHGAKNTQQWQGPSHCFIKREDRWVPLDKV